MKSILKTCSVLTLVTLGWGVVSGYSVQAAGLDITGSYTLSGKARAQLDITAEDEHYVVLLAGGGQEAAGPATAADCYIKAIGKLKDTTLVADFTAIETDTFSYSEAQAKQEKRQLKIRFNKTTAEVIEANTFGYCGMGADFSGRYRRSAIKR